MQSPVIRASALSEAMCTLTCLGVCPACDEDLKDALSGVLMVPRTMARSENRQPTKAELARRYKLDGARDQPSACDPCLVE